ncbi:MAG: TIGR02444 family protein [Burkholderiales bacterium]|nr:TIGR02444 family protein [Burkholderiales bacterium]
MQRTPHDFWRFSLRVYRAGGVESACLALQDGCGADVNLLLFCGWLAGRGWSLDRRRLRQAMARVGAWQSEVVVPLRAARRAHKRLAADAAAAHAPHDGAPSLHQRLLALELDLEYAEQSMLVALAASWPAPARTLPCAAAARASLERYLQLLEGGPETDAAPALARLVAAFADAGPTASAGRPADAS